MSSVIIVVVFLGKLGHVDSAWSSEELLLYDLVEDVNMNFYELFGITQNASAAEVRKAYRKLSLEWHPDRNNAPNAVAMFRKVVSIYEVLKSPELRSRYDNVLEFGLPDWKQPIFYYRKMRKLSWYEAVLVLLIVSTVTHYFMMWASYYEKYLVLSQNLRKSKKRKKGESEESLIQIKQALLAYRPQFRSMLPFLIAKGLWTSLSTFAMQAREIATTKQVEEQNIPETRRVTSVARAPEFTYEMATDLKAVSSSDPETFAKHQIESEKNIKKQRCEVWSCEELHQLVRLTMEKYPPGTPNRWERVAHILNRTPEDTAAMAAKLKQIKREELTKLSVGQQSNLNFDLQKAESAQGSLTEKHAIEWSQFEQKQLEDALQRYPRGCESRWDKIAAAVPTKSKQQCQERLKELVELVKQKKLCTN